MSKAPSELSPAGRQVRQERAQAAAMREIETAARLRREKSTELRKLRLKKESAAAAPSE